MWFMQVVADVPVCNPPHKGSQGQRLLYLLSVPKRSHTPWSIMPNLRLTSFINCTQQGKCIDAQKKRDTHHYCKEYYSMLPQSDR